MFDLASSVHAGHEAAKRFDQCCQTSFARGRIRTWAADNAQSQHEAAKHEMSSEQLKAFEVREAPEALKKDFGDTPFGRACLAAIQLIAVGVRALKSPLPAGIRTSITKNWSVAAAASLILLLPL